VEEREFGKEGKSGECSFTSASSLSSSDIFERKGRREGGKAANREEIIEALQSKKARHGCDG